MTKLRRSAGPETQHLCCLPPSLSCHPLVLGEEPCFPRASSVWSGILHLPPLTSWPPQHPRAEVLSAGPWGLMGRGRHSLLETHTSVRADRVSPLPPGSESQPWFCSHLSQVGGHLMGRNGREGFLGTGLGSWPMWERDGGLGGGG